MPLLVILSSGSDQCLTRSRCTVNIFWVTHWPSLLYLYWSLCWLVWFGFFTLYFNTPPCLFRGFSFHLGFFVASLCLRVPVRCLFHLPVGPWHLPSSWLSTSHLRSLISCDWYLLLFFGSSRNLLVTLFFFLRTESWKIFMLMELNNTHRRCLPKEHDQWLT